MIKKIFFVCALFCSSFLMAKEHIRNLTTTPDQTKIASRFKYIDFYGYMQFSAEVGENFSRKIYSDAQARVLELGAFATVTDRTYVEFTMLYDTSFNPFQLDKLLLYYYYKGWEIKAGKSVLPFGTFDRYLVSYPMTLKIARGHGSTAEAIYKMGNLKVSAFSFNGDTKKSDLNRLDDYGGGIEFKSKRFLLDIDFINNYLNSDYMVGKIVEDKELHKKVPALFGKLKVSMGQFSFTYEHFMALGRTDYRDVSRMPVEYVTVGDPRTLSGVEISVKKLILDYTINKHFIALAYESADEVETFDLPDQIFYLVGSYQAGADQTVKLEYRYSKSEFFQAVGHKITAQWNVFF